MKRLRVAVVDDSAIVRKTVRRILEEDPRFEVAGVGANGADALELVANLRPDLLTLDLDMPLVSGMSVLPRLINEYQQKVVILSTLTTANSYPTFKALALGAVDFVTKPGAGAYLRDVEELGLELTEKLAAAATVPSDRLIRRPRTQRSTLQPPLSESPGNDAAPRCVIGIGGSTGCTSPLETILGQMPLTRSSAVLVVQHLPVGYSVPFVDYLDQTCPFAVREAEEGEAVRPHFVYVAPGGRHLRVQPIGDELRLRIDSDGAPIHGFRPAIDELFYSLASAVRTRAIGVLLSGMGRDGSCGLAAIRRLGGHTLAQLPDECIVPEMPMAAAALGGVERFLPADQIGQALDDAMGEKRWTHGN